MALNNGGTLFTVSPPPNNEIENYFHDPSSKEVPLDSEGRAWNRTHYRYDAKNLPKTSVTADGTLPVSFIGGQVVLTGAVTSITLPTAAQLKTQIESVWGAGTSTFYPWAWVVRTEFDNQTAGAVGLVMGTGDTALPGTGITFPANSLSEVEFQIMNSSPTSTAIRVALIGNSSAASGSNVTLTDDGQGTSIIVDGVGPDLEITSFRAGTIQQDGTTFEDTNLDLDLTSFPGSIYISTPDASTRNAGDIIFQGANDAETIQNAIDAVFAIGGGTVIVPSYKSWDTSDAILTLRAGVTLSGPDDGLTTIFTDSTQIITAHTNTRLKNLSLHVVAPATDTTFAVTALFGNFRCDNVIFQKAGADIQGNGHIFDLCQFLSYEQTGVLRTGPTGPTPCRNIKVTRSVFGPWMATQAGYVTTTNGGSALSGTTWANATNYTQGDIVVNSLGQVYVAQTTHLSVAPEPTAKTTTAPDGGGNTWSYVGMDYSTQITSDGGATQASNQFSVFAHNIFNTAWNAIDFCFGDDCIFHSNSFLNHAMHTFIPGATSDTPTSNVRITQNSFQQIGSAFEWNSSSADDFHCNYVISNNTFNVCKQNITINCTNATGVNTAYKNMTIHGNQINGYSDSGITVSITDSTTDEYWDNIVITSNNLDTTLVPTGATLEFADSAGAASNVHCIITNNITGGIALSLTPAAGIANQLIYTAALGAINITS